ncbi:hypothetical protein [Streptomyces xantholiticus]|uniref:Uncharacterized protein n=1 Tax=Streptomyces xantholiticus TaxID=68285 RepID=A0ABV1V0N7_9ACTN
MPPRSWLPPDLDGYVPVPERSNGAVVATTEPEAWKEQPMRIINLRP